MVFSETENKKHPNTMKPETSSSTSTTSSSSSRALKDSDLPRFKWGSRKLLRSQKDTEERSRGKQKLDELNLDESDEGIEAMREKVMLDLRSKADELKDAFLSKKQKNVVAVTPELDHGLPTRPWNLRSRKKAGAGSGGEGGNERKKPFSIRLTEKEIEEDFMKLFGRKPPRKPNKRPYSVQRDLCTVFPGLEFGDVSVDKYKVPEEKGKGKGKQR